ncbi:hypothetical protein [Aquimarina sp. AU58]|nr:hypothetical protein [Aquimarina sp. AU58]
MSKNISYKTVTKTIDFITFYSDSTKTGNKGFIFVDYKSKNINIPKVGI